MPIVGIVIQEDMEEQFQEGMEEQLQEAMTRGMWKSRKIIARRT